MKTTILIFVFAATFYPENGGEPVPGVVVKKPDGTSEFVAFIPESLPMSATPIQGTLQVKPKDGATTTQRGALQTTEKGKGIFTPDTSSESGIN